MTQPQGPSAQALASAPASAAHEPRLARRKALLAVMVLVLIGAFGYAGYWWFLARGIERTDNAYVHAPMVQVVAQQAGTVVSVAAEDTDRVAMGQVLLRLDPAEARLARERAEAQLAQAVREIRASFARDPVDEASIRRHEADLQRARTEEGRASDDLTRRQPLVASGALGAEEIAHAQSALAAARAARAAAQSALEAAREQRLVNRTQIDGLRIEQHPSVQRAATALREAILGESRNDIPAPVAGQIARRSVQVGQRVSPGQVLMSVVSLDQIWVEANFKESQLRDMRVGQSVRLYADLHGARIAYRGRVAGFGAGTGAAFAVLPAQNASGNWVKVVQRVPVRIELDAAQLAEHPLRVGLSMHATIDVSGRAEAIAPQFTSPVRTQQTSVYDQALAAADQRVQAIIRQHAGASRARP